MADDDLKKVPARFYETDSGNEPVREWLLSLSKADRKAIGNDVATVEYGWPIGMPTCRPMGGGLFEVRTKLDRTRRARILFCVYDGHLVLLHGFIKKAQTTPKADLDLARTRQKEVEG
jgi:phage-related protein